jgi:adenosylmethionine-8-amino-7-oxononanoate aminotransferase
MQLTERQKQLIKRTFIDYKATSDFLETPLIFNEAEGLYVWDIEGKRYFDGIGGVFTVSLGHRHPRVMEAMRAQMEKITFAAPLHGISDVALEFVDKVGSIAPGNLKYVKAYCGGSESIESAMKFTRQYFKQTGHPQKYKFLGNYLGYHGATMGTMSAGGNTHYKIKFEPQMPGFIKNFSPIQLRDRFSSWEETCRFCAKMFEDIIISEIPETVAGILIEPICNTGGIITPTDEYFNIIRDICDRYNVMLIFDEVLTGYGKTGDMFAAQTFGVVPDIICSGKGLSSGAVPLGAMMVREDYASAFEGKAADGVHFFHGHTFAGNPMGAAVGIAVIDEMVEKNLPLKSRQNGVYLREKLEGLKKYGVIREVRGKGTLLGVELVQDTTTMKPFPKGKKLGDALKKTTAKNGLIIRIDPDWFAVAPPLVIEKKDIDEMVGLIEQSLNDALEMV